MDILKAIDKDANKNPTKYKAPSNFHFVLNTNISHYDLNTKTQEQKLDLIAKMKEASIKLRDNIDFFQKSGYNANIEEFSANIEVGKNRKFLHIDGYIFLDGYAQLDFKKITQNYNDYLKTYSKGCYLNVKYIHDNIKSTIDYSKKDDIKLV
jgi:hypothetical protein